MRPRYQAGQICVRGSYWVIRFREERITDGQIKRIRTTVPLALYSEHPYKTDRASIDRLRRELKTKIDGILDKVNTNRPIASIMSLGDFIELSYFKRLEERLKFPPGNELHIEPSTVKGYKDIWKVHVQKNPIVKIRLQNFADRDARIFLEGLPQHLSHQTHLRIKNFLRGVLSWAIDDKAFSGNNPIADIKVGGQTKKSDVGLSVRQRKMRASNAHAYTLAEVADMLDKLFEPARTVCAVAAFTGLTRSELRGLKWSDYDGEQIYVHRKIWRDQIGSPKTEAREAGVYTIPLLRKILKGYKRKFPPVADNWIFRGEKLLRPLDLDNLSRREISHHISGAWFGWHAFRRGLGTRLYEAGIKDIDIQSILRHADVSTTMAYYIAPDKKRAEAGLKKLGKVVQRKYGIKS